MAERFVFIDRDGVINRDGTGRTPQGYTTKWEDFEFLPGSLEALRKFNEAGYKCIVVSNQKCVATGLMTEEELESLTDKFTRQVKENGGSIDKVYYCMHRDEDNCSCRKPKEGMFLKAQEELGVHTFKGKYYIGDTKRDIQAGRKIGLTTILVLSGKSTEDDVSSWEEKPDYVLGSLLEAANMIIEGEK